MKKIFLVFILICFYACGCGSDKVPKEDVSINSENDKNKSYESTYDGDVEVKDSEAESKIIDSYEWEYDENNYFSISILQDSATKKKNVLLLGTYEEDKKGLMQFDFAYFFALSYSNSIDSSAYCTVGDESYNFLMSDGQTIINTIDLEEASDFPEEYEELSKEMANEMNEFYSQNGISEME